MPIKDYICNRESCKDQGIIELLVGLNENPACPHCGDQLQYVYIDGPAGLVRGSRTPCHKKYEKHK